MDFECDPDKDTAIDDPDHSADEKRFLTTGYSASQRLVIVAHTDRDGRVPIFSARHVTAAERRTYEEGDEKPER